MNKHLSTGGTYCLAVGYAEPDQLVSPGLLTSVVVEGGGSYAVPPNIFGEHHSPNDIGWGHGDTLAFAQVGLQSNAKSMVS